jgi:1-acyl-sn-glycerol-3-phosphate acyltransferase
MWCWLFMPTLPTETPLDLHLRRAKTSQFVISTEATIAFQPPKLSFRPESRRLLPALSGEIAASLKSLASTPVHRNFYDMFAHSMFRAALICIFLPLYILIVGPPLLAYTALTKNVDPLYWAAIKGIMFFVNCVGVHVHVKGLERIPPQTCIFAANHTSSADAPAVVWAIPRRIAILLKRSLFKFPIVGLAFRLAHFIPVDRFDRDSAINSLEKATGSLRNGQSFLIYPEGTRSPDGRLQRFKKGTAVMAIKAGVTIVPVACSAAHRVMERRKLKITPGGILVEFLDPINAADYSPEQRDALTERLHDAIAAGLPPDQRPLGFPGAS